MGRGKAIANSILVATVSAQAFFCPVEKEFCFQAAVPQTVARSGQGNVYFQLQALDSYTWAAIGTGTRMSGSSMFIIYSDGSGNVTVSPRSARGHNQPQVNSAVEIQMLDGSGVNNGVMTANFLCSNCDTIMDIATQKDFVGAWQTGGAVDSSSVSASISQHDDTTLFELDMSQAKALIATDANPYAKGSSTNGGNGNSNGNNSGNSSNGVGLSSGSGGSKAKKSTVDLVLLHGVIMAVVFIFMYPVGAILMPIVGKWLVHASWQMVAFVAMWAGFGVGYSRAQNTDMLFKQPHTVLGTVVCIAMVIQPVIGFLHHRYYKKYQTRGVISYAHIWYGRLIMFIGILNGGLGLQLAGAPKSFTIAYSVIAALVGIAYCASSYIGEMRRSRHQKEGGYQATYSPRAGTAQAYKPQPRGQYSPVQSSFPAQGRPQQQGQYAPRDQYQSNQYGSYR
jgi:hypothetical protein